MEDEEDGKFHTAGTDAHDSDADSEFGDNAEDEEAESVFAKMERLRAELEGKIGFDQFFAVFKQLQKVFADEVDHAVPDITRADAIKSLAKDPAESEVLYFRMLELVKLESGVFV